VNILVTFALQREFAPWCSVRTFRAEPGPAAAQPPVRVFCSEAGATRVRAAITGIGPRAAAQAMAALLASPPEVCISAGLAGGLRPQHRSGDVLLARVVRPLEGDRQLRCDSGLLSASRFLSCRIADLFLSSPRVIGFAWEKRRLGRLADAVEMESLAVLEAARRCGSAVLAVRAIADTCDEDLPYDFGRFVDAHGQPKLSRALAEVARRPLRLPALLRLNRRSRQAAEALCRFLEDYVQLLPQLLTHQTETPEGVAAT
jgi:nucleoside phosphorylase